MKKFSSGKLSTLTDGIIKSNPVFRLVLGTCPTLALTTAAMNGIYMGLCTMFVLLGSNVLVSLLRKIIPDKVRIPCYVLIIATFTTLLEMLMRKFMVDVYETLGLYLPLIVVNCIILARAEAFAASNTVGNSALDAIGMGIGFMLSLTVMGAIREFIGTGELFGFAVGNMSEGALSVFILPAGGFLVYGLMMAAINWLYDKYEKRKSEEPLPELDFDLHEELSDHEIAELYGAGAKKPNPKSLDGWILETNAGGKSAGGSEVAK